MAEILSPVDETVPQIINLNPLFPYKFSHPGGGLAMTFRNAGISFRLTIKFIFNKAGRAARHPDSMSFGGKQLLYIARLLDLEDFSGQRRAAAIKNQKIHFPAGGNSADIGSLMIWNDNLAPLAQPRSGSLQVATTSTIEIPSQ